MAHHAFDRTDSYPRFASRQAGADLLLSLLPADEQLLRVAAMTVTFVAGFAAVLLLSAVVSGWTGEQIVSPLLIALALPELLFLSLVYQPALIAFAFALGSHLLIRLGWSGSIPALFAGGILLGVAGVIRLDILGYGLLIALDARYFHRDLPSAIRKTAHVAGLAAIAWLLSALALGEGLAIVTDAWHIQVQSIESGRSVRNTFASYSALLTPAVIILVGIAGFTAPRRSRILLFETLGIAIVIALLVRIANPKSLLFVVPVLCLGVTEGARWLVARATFGKMVLAALILMPWLVGFQVQRPGTQWGPDFSIREPSDRVEHASVSLLPRESTALPTPEGPRPLYAYGHVLFGGAWRDLVNDLAYDREVLVESAIATGTPLLVAQGSTGYMAAELAARDFVPAAEPRDSRSVSIQEYVRGDERVLLWRVDGPDDIDDDFRIAAVNAGHTSFLVTGYSSTVSRLAYDPLLVVEILGPQTMAILDVGEPES